MIDLVTLYMLSSFDILLDQIISISSVLEDPSLLLSWFRLNKPLYTPSVTTLSIWIVTLPRVVWKSQHLNQKSHSITFCERWNITITTFFIYHQVAALCWGYNKHNIGNILYLPKGIFAFANDMEFLPLWGHIKSPCKAFFPLWRSTVAHHLIIIQNHSC